MVYSYQPSDWSHCQVCDRECRDPAIRISRYRSDASAEGGACDAGSGRAATLPRCVGLPTLTRSGASAPRAGSGVCLCVQGPLAACRLGHERVCVSAREIEGWVPQELHLTRTFPRLGLLTVKRNTALSYGKYAEHKVRRIGTESPHSFAVVPIMLCLENHSAQARRFRTQHAGTDGPSKLLTKTSSIFCFAFFLQCGCTPAGKLSAPATFRTYTFIRMFVIPTHWHLRSMYHCTTTSGLVIHPD